MSTVEFKECRYNKNHKVKAGRLFVHECNCPDKVNSYLVRCSYDLSHMIKKTNLEEHLRVCPKRPKIDINLHQEMVEYLQKNGSKNKSNSISSAINKSPSANSNNNTAKKSIAGLGPIEDKKEKKKQQREYRQLINNSNIFNGMSQIDEDEKYSFYDVDNEFKKEFEDSTFSNNKDDDNFEIVNVEESVSANDNDGLIAYLDINNPNNKKKMLLFHSSKLDYDDYDPNSSDIFIGRKNKNNINDSEFVYYK